LRDLKFGINTMSMYDLDGSKDAQSPAAPEVSASSPAKKEKNNPSAILIVIAALAVGFGLGALSLGSLDSLAKSLNIQLPASSAPKTNQNLDTQNKDQVRIEYMPQTTQEEAVIKAVKDYSPAVVSIIITKDMPIYEQYYTAPSDTFDPFGFWEGFQMPQMRQKGTQKQEVGAGTGFIVSEGGILVTNKHVVSDANAQYTVIMADGSKYPAKVLALDPVQDLAIVQITGQEGKKFPSVKLGNSDNVQIGQSVIAIGNTLGEFDNTVSVGVISGLRRSITASGGGNSETLDNLIQTDAAINEGNSGGPLLNLKGEVIGVNTAVASGAENVGFVLPINFAIRDIEQVKKNNKITYPYLGIYYTIIDDDVKKENDLPVNYGAWITSPGAGRNGKAIAPVIAGSPGKAAGLKDGDIILEINREKIDKNNTLSQIIAKYNSGDKVTLRVQRDGKQIDMEAILGDRSENQ